MDRATWRTYLAGYEAGYRHGLAAGRDQLAAEQHTETATVWAEFAAQVRALGRRPGPMDHHGHQTWIAEQGRRATARWANPALAGLSGQALIDAAAATWTNSTTTAGRTTTASRPTNPGRATPVPPRARRPHRNGANP